MPQVTQPPQKEEDLTTEDPSVEETPDSGSDEGNENTGNACEVFSKFDS